MGDVRLLQTHMARLTKEQREFLTRHGIPIYKTFDATGMSSKKYGRLMRELELAVAFGVTPCGAARHTLRSRAGHCVQCGTHHLAFQGRYDEPAYLYIASSQSTGLTKIGVARDAEGRATTLNYFAYGGARDWEMKFVQKFPKAGRIENIAHSHLASCSVERIYEKQGADVRCRELFECDAETARRAVELAAKHVVGE